VLSALVTAKVPEAVTAIVLEDPPLYRDLAMVSREVFGAFHELLRDRPSRETIEQTVRRLDPEGPAANIAERTASLAVLDPTFLEATHTAEVWDAMAMDEEVIPRLVCPTLLVHGDRDFAQRPSVLTAERVASVAERMSRCTVKHIGGVGHMIHLGQRERFVEAVTEFLSTVE
jgi:pimeloyl-ACP methyl ester carboxylesterase